MEVAIFSLANFLAILIFLSFTALPLSLLWLSGAELTTYLKIPYLKWLLPFGTLITVGLWLFCSVNAFQTACKSARGIEVFTKIHGTPIGFSVEDTPNPFGGWQPMNFGWNAPLEKEIFQFVDIGKHRRCAKNECNKNIPPQFSVHFLNERVTNRWWFPPIYESKIEIRDINDGTVFASATDIVFGGGLVGKYMRLIGGDQDFELLSCGYASPEIGSWRPTLATRPRVSEYKRADVALLLAPFQAVE